MRFYGLTPGFKHRAPVPGSRLVRADSNRGLGDRAEGRIYLRYRHQGGGITELWGNAADGVGMDLERGIVQA